MTKPAKHRSRRKTPWNEQERLTPMQIFLTERYESHYKERHPKLTETGEVELINSLVPETCPHCAEKRISKFGQTKNGVKRYICKDCGKTFTPLTGTIFDGHKISISEWMEYCLNIFRYLSITADAWNNRNAFTTSRYWLEKLFLVLDDYYFGTTLSGRVWLDETYYTVRSTEIVRKSDGTKPRGLSNNQLCIGVACTEKEILCLCEGRGQASATKAYAAFGSHIAPGSTLVHDAAKAHGLLIENLNLVSEAYVSAEIKELPDKDNPLNRVNQVHARLKNFLYAHNSFNRDSIDGYLNLFTFAMNPPDDHLEKVELLLNRALRTHKILRYRTFFKVF